MKNKAERVLFALCLSLITGCASTQLNLNRVQMGMTPYQTDALLGSRIETANKLGYDIIKYPYYDLGSQTDVIFAVFKDNSLVGLYNSNNYFSWKEREFMRIYSDPNTPQTVREAYRMQYEQDQANNRANTQAMAAIAGAMLQQPAYQMPVSQPVQPVVPQLGGQRLNTNCTTNYIGSTAYTNCS